MVIEVMIFARCEHAGSSPGWAEKKDQVQFAKPRRWRLEIAIARPGKLLFARSKMFWIGYEKARVFFTWGALVTCRNRAVITKRHKRRVQRFAIIERMVWKRVCDDHASFFQPCVGGRAR